MIPLSRRYDVVFLGRVMAIRNDRAVEALIK